jgi:hypothetical protein
MGFSPPRDAMTVILAALLARIVSPNQGALGSEEVLFLACKNREGILPCYRKPRSSRKEGLLRDSQGHCGSDLRGLLRGPHRGYQRCNQSRAAENDDLQPRDDEFDAFAEVPGGNEL